MIAIVDAWTNTKKCKVCTKRKTLSLYHPNKCCRLGVVATCRDCTGNRIKQWYKDNRAKRQLDANKRNQARRDSCIAELGGKCFDCAGVFHRSVYDFHHRDPSSKVDSISNLLRSPDKLKEELKKCDLLCANCHRIRHFKEDT